VWNIDPAAQVLGAKVITTKTWDAVSVELKLGVLAEGTTVQQVDGAALYSGQFTLASVGDVIIARPILQNREPAFTAVASRL
jgi:hypothetical protein